MFKASVLSGTPASVLTLLSDFISRSFTKEKKRWWKCLFSLLRNWLIERTLHSSQVSPAGRCVPTNGLRMGFLRHRVCSETFSLPRVFLPSWIQIISWRKMSVYSVHHPPLTLLKTIGTKSCSHLPVCLTSLTIALSIDPSFRLLFFFSFSSQMCELWCWVLAL